MTPSTEPHDPTMRKPLDYDPQTKKEALTKKENPTKKKMDNQKAILRFRMG